MVGVSERLLEKEAGDVTDQEQVCSVVDQATQRFGRIDIVVNNAGIIQVGPMSTTTVEDFANALDVMFWGALYPTLAVLPQMRARRSGHVVNITSIGRAAAHRLHQDTHTEAAPALSAPVQQPRP
jgi:NADP-dependent 3-hydroxy acid dehydrogenase YdfG